MNDSGDERLHSSYSILQAIPNVTNLETQGK